MQNNEIAPAALVTRVLGIHDLERLSDALRLRNQPTEIFRAVHAVAEQTIGLRLFTIMSYDAQRLEVERVYTNMPDVYPTGGRKQKQGTAWASQVLLNLKPFRAETPQGIQHAFDDHAVMTGMGLGSILNIPIAYDGVCVGTMNMTHREGWYTARDEQIGMLIGSFLAAALLRRNPMPVGDSTGR
jgi:transcriptional regulator with GAF, ATPase, and Fis domain